jgi:hypothetical protein
MKTLFLAFISLNLWAYSYQEYKKDMLSLSPEQLWSISLLKKEGKGVWYFTDKPIKKTWYGTGACFVKDQRTCADCTCDYSFKSKHPNNRYLGDFPYQTYNEGYPHHPDKIPVSGCMPVLKLKGDCNHLSQYGLCNISSDVKVVFKKFFEKALKDKKDPCGLREFAKSNFFQEVSKKIKALSQKKGED